MAISPPFSTSRMLRWPECSRTARRTSSRARRRKRCRLARLLPAGLRRRSMMFIRFVSPLPAVLASSGLLDPHVPFNQPPYLTFRVAALDHPLDELVVLPFGLAVLLGAEADHRQQLLDLAEHAALDDL